MAINIHILLHTTVLTVLWVIINSIFALFLSRKIFPKNHWSCLNISSEIIFLKGRSNVMGYQETLHDELLPFVTVIEDEKTILSARQRSHLCSRHYKKVVLRFRNRIITMVSIQFWSEPDREPARNSSETSLRSGGVTYRKLNLRKE